MENKKKQEEVSPEELWRKVSQQLSSKKNETASKMAYTTMFDLSVLNGEIQKIRKDKQCNNICSNNSSNNNGNSGSNSNSNINNSSSSSSGTDNLTNNNTVNIATNNNTVNMAATNNIKVEIENSILNTPYFKEIEPKYPILKPSKVPSFFPKHPFVHFNNPNFYKKFELETLFFIFYYFKESVQQTYAAIRLKQYAWRFHLKYKMWFQRLDEPKLITSEYEKGEFIFFDYETSWTFMKKSDFVFEYFYLEHNDYY